MQSLRNIFRNLLPVDWIVILYNISIIILFYLSPHLILNQGYMLSVHFLIIIWILFLAWNNGMRETKINRWLRLWYPLILLIWFTPETGLLQNALFHRSFDTELLIVETTLFPERYYFTTPLSLTPFTHELLHGIIFSFFLMLWVPAWLVRKIKRLLIQEYVFVLIFTILIHFWIGILLPIDGPSSLRHQVIPKGWLFIPLINFITQSAFKGGSAVGGLFAATAVVIAAYSAKLFSKGHRLFIVWLFILIISTVICTFQYSVSAITGILTGTLFLVTGKKLYEKIL